jgi:mannosyltransferase
MSTTTHNPPPRTRPFALPELRDLNAPGWVTRRPQWLVASVVLVVLLAISAVLRTRELSGQFWFTEAIATGIAQHSFGGVLHAAKANGGAPLYYILLHWWTSGFGTTEAEVRGLSLLFSLLTIPAAGWAAWSLGGARAGYFAATVFAFGSIGTQYAEQAQPYSLLLLLGVLAITGFLHAFVYRRRRYLWLFVGATEAALYTQGSTGLFLFGLTGAFAMVVGCASAEQRRGILRDGALCLAAIVVLYIPWIPATIDQVRHATSPWHYAPLVGVDMPGDLIGGDRMVAVLAVTLVTGAGPLLLTRAQRRSPAAIVMWALTVILLPAIALAAVADLAAPDWVARYFTLFVGPLLLLIALSAARARIVGVFVVVLCIAFGANPASFAAGHLSNMAQIANQTAPALHDGDLVVVAQPEQTPLAAYYMDSGLRFSTTTGPTSDPTTMDWMNAEQRLRDARPAATLGPLVASLRPGQQLLYVRPLTEGDRNWKRPYSELVRRRAAQWGQLLTEDVDNGTLKVVETAPDTYPGDCCVANSAVLYRKAS